MKKCSHEPWTSARRQKNTKADDSPETGAYLVLDPGETTHQHSNNRHTKTRRRLLNPPQGLGFRVPRTKQKCSRKEAGNPMKRYLIEPFGSSSPLRTLEGDAALLDLHHPCTITSVPAPFGFLNVVSRSPEKLRSPKIYLQLDPG